LKASLNLSVLTNKISYFFAYLSLSLRAPSELFIVLFHSLRTDYLPKFTDCCLTLLFVIFLHSTRSLKTVRIILRFHLASSVRSFRLALPGSNISRYPTSLFNLSLTRVRKCQSAIILSFRIGSRQVLAY
jgi:hypothetical protein